MVEKRRVEIDKRKGEEVKSDGEEKKRISEEYRHNLLLSLSLIPILFLGKRNRRKVYMDARFTCILSVLEQEKDHHMS